MKKIFYSIFIVALLISCGESDSNEVGLDIITSSEKIYTFDDLKEMGFKKNREYDIEQLPGATEAYFGFWGIKRSESKDYEVRFYSSHSDAVNLGESLAIEVSGNDAIIAKDETTWKEGSKDRRQVGGGVDKGSLGLQATGIFPKYGNYVIYGNMVILCEGQEGIALETCWDLINAIESE